MRKKAQKISMPLRAKCHPPIPANNSNTLSDLGGLFGRFDIIGKVWRYLKIEQTFIFFKNIELDKCLK